MDKCLFDRERNALPYSHCKYALLTFLALLFFSVETLQAAECAFLPDAPAPEWIKSAPSISGFYAGVGSAGKKENWENQINASFQSGLADIAQQFSISVEHSFTDIVGETRKGATSNSKQSVQMVTKTSVQQLLQDAAVHDKWLDRKSCVLWTLVKIPKGSMLSNEKLRLVEALIENCAETMPGTPQEKLALLKRGGVLLGEVVFSYIHGHNEFAYYRGIIDELKGKYSGMVAKNGTVIVARQNGEIPAEVFNLLTGKIASIVPGSNPVPGKVCNSTDSCLDTAKSYGANRMIYVEVEADVKGMVLGAHKGTLKVSVSAYDVGERRAKGTPIVFKSSVFAPYDKNGLDWLLASKKIADKGKWQDLTNSQMLSGG